MISIESMSILKMNNIDISISLAIFFFFLLSTVIIQRPSMFTKRLGRKHSILGAFYLIWLIYGISDCTAVVFGSHIISNYIAYDIILGCAGVLLPLTAAYEFKHYNVKNIASGTLDEHATVTYNEMIEHSFYQGVNLIQVLYLHTIAYITHQQHNQHYNTYIPIICLITATSPWLFRHHFPINKFSDNYTKIDNTQTTLLIKTLYRIKKYQYIFYKHFLLHGLNISICLSYILHNTTNNTNTYTHTTISLITNTIYFRLYWLLLNTSYVMEFFLQTLVKKKYIKQYYMLILQHILMLSSSIIAINILYYITIYIAILSLIFNFINRKYDFMNVILVLFISMYIEHILLT